MPHIFFIVLAFLASKRLVTAFHSFPRRLSNSLKVQATRSQSYVPDAWDEEMLKALGYDENGTSEPSPPLLSPEDELVMRQIRFHIRSHLSRVIQVLVAELQRIYIARFHDNSPLTWKLIRKAALETRKDLSNDNIEKAEATRLFIRNTLTRKLSEVDVDLETFFAAADVTSTEWRDCRRRGGEGGAQPAVNSKGENCFIEIDSSDELIKCLENMKPPPSLGDGLLHSFDQCLSVVKKTAPLLEKDKERLYVKIATQHLASSKKSRRKRASLSSAHFILQDRSNNNNRKA